MDACEQYAMDTMKSTLVQRLQIVPEHLMNFLQVNQVITNTERLIVRSTGVTPENTVMVLLDLIKGKDDGWKTLVAYFDDNNQRSTSNNLECWKKYFHECLNCHFEDDSNPKELLKSLQDRITEGWISAFAEVYKIKQMFWQNSKYSILNNSFLLQILETAQGQIIHQDIFFERFKDGNGNKVTLFDGDSGGPKTRFVEAMGHQWAARQRSRQLTPDDYDLVLHVRKTEAYKNKDNVLLTALRDFCPDLNEANLSCYLKNLNVLICLDRVYENQNGVGPIRQIRQIQRGSLVSGLSHQRFRRTNLDGFPY